MGSESNGCPDSGDRSEIRTDIKPSSKREQEGDSGIVTIRLEDQKTKTESINRNIQSANLHPVIEETRKKDDREEKKSESKEPYLEVEDPVKPQATMKDMFDKQGTFIVLSRSQT
jgi:hypothetical protein